MRALAPAVVPKLHLKPEGSHVPVSPPASVSLWNHAGFSVQRVCGDPANASVWVLAGFREEMPDGTGRLQSNLDSGGYLWKVKGQVLLSCPTLFDPIDFGSMEFCRQEYWSGQPFPSPGDLPIPGVEHRSPHAGRFFTT